MSLPTRPQPYCDLASLVLLFQYLWVVIALLLQPKCMVTAPAHHHVTWVAVNPALFFFPNAILGPAVLRIFFRLYCLGELVHFQ